MKKSSFIIIPFLICVSLHCFGQDQYENILQFDEAAGSPEADLGAVAWIAGHWRGEALGGVTASVRK